MLRRVLVLLLALVLAFNGLLAPSAMAAAPTAATSAETASPPCHGMDEPASDGARGDEGKPAHPMPDCCQQGHCVCACLFSLPLSLSRFSLPARTTAVLAGPVARAAAAVRPGVPLRPPIA